MKTSLNPFDVQHSKFNVNPTLNLEQGSVSHPLHLVHPFDLEQGIDHPVQML
jgi:hypothetical protein